MRHNRFTKTKFRTTWLFPKKEIFPQKDTIQKLDSYLN